MAGVASSISRQCLCRSSTFPPTSSAIAGSTLSLLYPPTRNQPRPLSFSSGSSTNNKSKTALILGSSGCLGRTVAQYFSNNLDMQVIGADVCELPNDTDTTLNGFVSLSGVQGSPTVAEMTSALSEGVSNVLNPGEEVDVIVCASGGFQMDPTPPSRVASEQDFLDGAKEYGDAIDKMIAMNLYSVVSAGYLTHRFMAKDGAFSS